MEDVGDGNGVFCRVREERELTAGGELRLGRQRLLLEPITESVPAQDGTLVFGSIDPGYKFRLIQLLDGGLRGAAFPLKDGAHMLGREVGDITFPTDGFVSGRHASLTVRDDQLWVKDLGSSNGTFIRLEEPWSVSNGDHFLIGRELVKVEIS
jgi:hypothetical protein